MKAFARIVSNEAEDLRVRAGLHDSLPEWVLRRALMMVHLTFRNAKLTIYSKPKNYHRMKKTSNKKKCPISGLDKFNIYVH